jgi:hypothetical protein
VVLAGPKDKRALGFLALLALAVLLCGCGGNGTNGPSQGDEAPASVRELPFRDAPAAVEVVSQIPAGTAIPIRLLSSISSASTSRGDRFLAMLDETLEVEGRIVARKGTSVTGRVLAARRSGRLENPGYLRITLDSMKLKGSPIALQTSSIFLQGRVQKPRTSGRPDTGALLGAAFESAGSAAYANSNKDVALGVDRRVTFRLVQPLVVKN